MEIEPSKIEEAKNKILGYKFNSEHNGIKRVFTCTSITVEEVEGEEGQHLVAVGTENIITDKNVKSFKSKYTIGDDLSFGFWNADAAIKPLDTSKLTEAVTTLSGNKYAYTDSDKGLTAFNVFKVDVDEVKTETETFSYVVAIGKEMSSTEKCTVTFRNRYIVYEDMSFGDWNTDLLNNDVENEVIAMLSETDSFDSNEGEISDFLTVPAIYAETVAE